MFLALLYLFLISAQVVVIQILLHKYSPFHKCGRVWRGVVPQQKRGTCCLGPISTVIILHNNRDAIQRTKKFTTFLSAKTHIRWIPKINKNQNSNRYTTNLQSSLYYTNPYKKFHFLSMLSLSNKRITDDIFVVEWLTNYTYYAMLCRRKRQVQYLSLDAAHAPIIRLTGALLISALRSSMTSI